MNLFSRLAWSDEMPALMDTFWRDVPFWASSTLPSSNAFSETWRLTSFSSSTWCRARRRSSVEERRTSSVSLSSMTESVFLKSKRVAASRLAWSTALRTSCMSTSETMSNVGMPSAYRRHPPCRGGSARLSSPAAGRCPSGQRKQAVNLSVNTYGGSNPSRPTQNPSGCASGGNHGPCHPPACRYNAVADRLRVHAPRACAPSAPPGRSPPDTTSETDTPWTKARCPLHHRSWTGSARASGGSPCGPTRCACASLRGSR